MPIDTPSVALPESPRHDTGGGTRSSYAMAVIECLQQKGLDPVDVLGAERVQAILQSEQRSRIALPDWLDLIEQACLATGNPLFTLEVAEVVRLRHIGVLGFLLSSCSTLREAGQILLRYEPLLDGVNTVDLLEDDTTCSLVWLPLIDNPSPSLPLLAMAIWAHQIRWLTDRPHFHCVAEFTFDAPPSPEHRNTMQAAFGGKLRFNAPRNSLTAPKEVLDWPISQRDPSVHRLLKQRADLELESLGSLALGLPAGIEPMIVRELHKGDVSLGHISQLLGVSARTLQARLRAAGLGYRDLVERVRLRQAQLLLSNLDTPIAEVANQLGYANQAAFQSAFKKWTGQTPGELRKQLLAREKS